MRANPISVMVADDHPVIVSGLKEIIESQPNLRFVGSAPNGRVAKELFLSILPDVLLIDLQMPEVDGLQAVRAIRAEAPEARMVILSGFDGEEDITLGLKAGAKAYLLKEASAATIVDCIAAVAEGRKYLSPKVAERLANRFDSDELSARELQILRLLSEGKSNKVISRLTGIGIGTTKFHVKNIFGKLGVSSRTEAMSIALRRGIIRF